MLNEKTEIIHYKVYKYIQKLKGKVNKHEQRIEE